MQHPWLAWLLLAVLFCAFVYGIRSVLAPFIIGFLAAYFLDPAADRLEKTGLGRGKATGLITLGFFLSLVLILAVLVPPLLEQTRDLIDAMPGYMQKLQANYGPDVQRLAESFGFKGQDALKNAAGNVTGDILAVSGGLALGIYHSGMTMLNVVSLLLITPLVVFYLLRDWDRVLAAVDSLLPVPYAATIREQARAIDDTLAGFIRGQINVCLVLATYYGLLLTVLGVPFGLAIGILTGLLTVLPYVGFLTGFLAAMGVSFMQFGFTTPFFLVLGVYGVGQALETYFLTPKMVGDRVGLHPLWIIFGMLAGASLLGFVGVLLSVPLTAVIGVLVRFAVQRYRESPLYHGA